MKVASIANGSMLLLDECKNVGELRQSISEKENTTKESIVMYNGDRLVTPMHDTLNLTNYKNSWVFKQGHHITITNSLTKQTHREYYEHNVRVNVNHLLTRYNGKYKSCHLHLVYKGVAYSESDVPSLITITDNDPIVIELKPENALVSGTIELGPDSYKFKDVVFRNDVTFSRVFDDVGRIYFTILGHDCRYNVDFFNFVVKGQSKSADDTIGFGVVTVKMRFQVPFGYCCVQSVGEITFMVEDHKVCDHSFFVDASSKTNLYGRAYSEFAVNRHVQIEICVPKTEVSPNLATHIYIRSLTGRDIKLEVNTSYLVYLVKLLVQNLDGLPHDQQRLIYGGQNMENHKTLADYKVSGGSTLHLVLRLRGGGCGEFIDLTKTEKRSKSDWADTAPPWRMATQGLGIVGKCKNFLCEAWDDQVLYNHGLQTFTLASLSNQVKCPMCEHHISAKSLTLNNCCWRFEGIKMSDPTVLIQTEWESIGDHIIHYDEHLTGNAAWKFLQVEIRKCIEGKSFQLEKEFIVQEKDYVDEKYNNKVDAYFEKNAVVLPDVTFCVICLSHSVVTDKLTRLGCSHIFHSKCIAEWMKRSKRCPCCNDWSIIA